MKMADVNLETYLNEQEAEYYKRAKKIEKRKKRFKIKLVIFSAIFVGLIAICLIYSSVAENVLYNDLKETNISDVEAISKIASSETAIAHYDLFDKYEAGYLGNSSLNSMNYGLIAENQYGYTSINDDNEVVLHTFNGQDNVISTEPISQINIAENLVIYRGTDKKLYTCNIDGTEKNLIVDNKVGTVLLVGEDIYFVNYSKSNNLYKYNLKEQKSVVVLEADIKNFTVAANKLLYLDNSNTLYAQTIGATFPSWTNSNVAKFYFNGDIYVQNNDKIIKFNLNNHFPKNIADGVNEFLGVDEDNIYYTINDKLYSQSLSDGKKTPLSYEFDYYKGVYSANGVITALGGVKK